MTSIQKTNIFLVVSQDARRMQRLTVRFEKIDSQNRKGIVAGTEKRVGGLNTALRNVYAEVSTQAELSSFYNYLLLREYLKLVVRSLYRTYRRFGKHNLIAAIHQLINQLDFSVDIDGSSRVARDTAILEVLAKFNADSYMQVCHDSLIVQLHEVVVEHLMQHSTATAKNRMLKKYPSLVNVIARKAANKVKASAVKPTKKSVIKKTEPDISWRKIQEADVKIVGIVIREKSASGKSAKALVLTPSGELVLPATTKFQGTAEINTFLHEATLARNKLMFKEKAEAFAAKLGVPLSELKALL